MTAGGLRAELAMPSVYFYLAVFDALGNIKSQWTATKAKILKLTSLNGGFKEDMGFEIYWDGACSADKILEYAPKGVKGFVLGTTLLFGQDKPYGNTLQKIRALQF